MASRSDSAGSLRPRARRSLAHIPRSRLTSTLDQENATTDISSSQPLDGRPKPMGRDKKSRSKSLGPGGLDALQDSNGNRRKSTAAFPLKSILKPTVPVSPVRTIPTFEETRKRTPARGSQPSISNETNTQSNEGLLIDLDTHAPALNNSDDRSNPFDSFNAASIRDEMAAAREKEEKEQRERERKMILEKREARRKSMANRRVSFAPEATLHTWNVVEIPDDSTSSSAANSTRRASSLAGAGNQTPAPQVEQAEQAEPRSSPDPYAESDAGFSPVQYPDLQQLQSQSTDRSYDESQEMFSSPFSGSSADGTEDLGLQRDDDDDDDNSSTSGFDGESTAMSLDVMSVHSPASVHSDGSDATTGSARLNEALRQAAREAGTRDFEDDDGDMSMEIADQEITGAFQPWIKKGQRESFDWADISARYDQENAPPSEPMLDAPPTAEDEDDVMDEDLSMEVTNAIGRILPIQASRHRSEVRRKSLSEETNYEEQTMEFTNVVGGIAQPISPAKSIGVDSRNGDEEMTMEFTSVVGGLLNSLGVANNADENDDDDQQEAFISGENDRVFSGWENANEMDDGMDMEITGAIGGIIPGTQESIAAEDDDQTAGMDMTAAVGKILEPEAEQEQGPQEPDEDRVTPEPEPAQLGSSPFQETSQVESASKLPVSFHVAAVASESGSPSLASVRARRTRQSLTHPAPTTPTPHTPQVSPPKDMVSPPNPSTPTVNAPSNTQSTTPSRDAGAENASPQKLSQSELQEPASNTSPRRNSLFGESVNGKPAPLFVLQPHGKRRSSGLGIDKEGLGSPRVAAMLDKRRSIGEEAPEFVPQEQSKQGVRFEDPVKLQEEVDREREEEVNREDGFISPPKLNDRDPTASLKDMISSLTPKKNKLRGRKSLHVGAARGLLGKRPVELDLDDDADSDHTPKRLRGRETSSPVKKFKLPAHSTNSDTFGRGFQSPLKTIGAQSPLRSMSTPTQTPKTISATTSPVKDNSDTASNSESTEVQDAPVEDAGPEVEPIQLQEFLNMTNIHFMELTTTKRRHTTAPDSARKRNLRLSSENEARSPASFEECVAAGFCTVPMLELFQHSCRELKSYINEGRQVIRSIETETLADNPPLFREYMTAPPDIRLLMDNQFRNVKTHARLLSKATWYEWRMKLLEGLRDGLNRHVQEMKADDELLAQHEALLSGTVPALIEKHSSLEAEATILQQLADELENCDQDELRSAREKLAGVEDEIAQKKKLLQEMQVELEDKTNIVETGTEVKAEYMAQIQEAERVKAECRGWSAQEISELKDSVRNIERQTGWSIVSATASDGSTPAGPTVTMSYRHQLQLTFHPASFLINNNTPSTTPNDQTTNAPITLKYAPTTTTTTTSKPTPSTTPHLSAITLLVLKSLQIHLTSIPQSRTAPKHLLHFIAQAWDLTLQLEEEARLLEFCGVTKLKLLEGNDSSANAKKTPTPAPSLRARCTLLNPAPPSSSSASSPSNCRIDVDFAVRTRILPPPQDGAGAGAGALGQLDLQTDVLASKVYGFTAQSKGLSETEMRSILNKGLSGSGAASEGKMPLGRGVWRTAVRKLTGTVF
ncbi:Spc7-domain-containing protein [Aspergillus japonicus CBS 114.51]|uniref:Spc7-domain-containing protein n=1 Tax=Aspergillus japonicus CBS 114.51 TaxID=1448312 RepID=A0A8T8WN86_ASPJA|nr:Spc7-domain-containing protein [Aspergillus japonicus CBS 114.51]RAH77308.1 Spc7-domain-containing protein [Aspergillus japonicus CBS 114.51]